MKLTVFYYKVNHNLKSLYISVLAIILIILNTVITFCDDDDIKNVLVLHSYHIGYIGTDDMQRAINDEFNNIHFKINMYVEYMDTKRNNYSEVAGQLYELFKIKYRLTEFDVIISTDDNALIFLLQYRNALFPDVPISFCGVNKYSDSLIEDHSFITGVAEDFDLRATLDIIQILFPKIDTIAVLAGESYSTGINLERFKSLAPEYKGKYTFIYLTNLTKEELILKFNSLSQNTAVFNLSFWIDREGVVLNHREGLELISKNCEVPIFTAWEHMIAYGTLGGMVTSGYLQAKNAAIKAKMILNGINPDTIPILRESPNIFIFDYNQMMRFGLNETDLPEGSLIINRPFSFYEEYKHIIWIVVIGFIILLCLIIYLIINILQRRKAELDLKISEKRYRLLTEASPFGIAVFDKNNMVKYINYSFRDIFGYDISEIPSIMDLFNRVLKNEEDKKSIINIYSNKQSDLNKNYEYQISGKDNADKSVNLRSVIMESGNILLFVEDITEKKKLLNQLEHSYRMEAIGTLAGGIAHDFNNILTGIMGDALLMLMDTEETHPHYSRLTQIKKLTKSASKLTSQLLGFARKGKYEVIPLNLNSIIKDQIQIIRHTKKEILINEVLEPDLWTVEADQSQMEQVLLNILINACQAMPEGGHIVIHTDNIILDKESELPYGIEPGNYIKISITDTGVGIDDEIKDKIFEPFFTTKEKGKASGLGLASTYGIVKNHNGYISVTSKKGKGSTFNIYLPASKKKVIEKNEVLVDIIRGNEKILLIDDEEHVQKVCKEMLEKIGYEVITVSNGKDAIETYNKGKGSIDLIILDIIMPDTDVGTLYLKLKRINPKVIVLLSSGYSINGKANEILNLGAQGFIQKPFSLTELSKKVREVLASRIG